jgi:protein-disulfide isomerase
MAKKARKSRQVRRKERGPNWLLIGAVVGAGVIGLFVFLFLSLQGQGMPTPTLQPNVALAEYCGTNEENCVSKGSAQAPVTIVEVSDYGCGHCRNFNLETAGALDSQYVEAGQIRWIVLPYA